MTSELLNTYRKFRERGGCIVGEAAKCALFEARTLLAFRELESSGVVRIRQVPEQESFADVFGAEIAEREAEYIDRWGCWLVVTEILTCEQCDTWKIAGSVGMCVYENPTDPFENAYIPALMREAIDAYEGVLSA